MFERVLNMSLHCSEKSYVSRLRVLRLRVVLLSINISESDHGELLGIIIEKYLSSFKKYIENLCRITNRTLLGV